MISGEITGDFKIGRRYYLKDGEEVELFCRTLDGDYVVNEVVEFTCTSSDGYDSHTGDHVTDKCIIVKELYHKPPVEKVSKEIIELNEKKSLIKKEISGMGVTKHNLEVEISNLKHRLEQQVNENMKYDIFREYIELEKGEIKYAVTFNKQVYRNDGLFILTDFEKLTKYENGTCFDLYNNTSVGFELIFNKHTFSSTGRLYQLVFKKSDDRSIYFFKSYEEAIGFISNTIINLCNNGETNYLDRIDKVLKHLKITPEGDLKEAIDSLTNKDRSTRVENLIKFITNTETERSKYIKQLEELQSMGAT